MEKTEEEFNKLQKENEKMRTNLYYDFWERINLLIENEIEQERFCNQ